MAVARALLVLAALLLGACGGPEGVRGGAAVDGAPVAFTLPESGLRGGLPVLLCLVDYADAACPYTEAQGAMLLQALDRFVVRESTGRCWVTGRVQRVQLPGNAAAYGGAYEHDAGDLGRPLMLDSRAATAGAPERYKLYLVPATSRVYFGAGRSDHGEGYAWLGALEEDPLRLPLVHEAGHALGLPHGGGVMSATDPAAQADWAQGFDAAALASLGWLRVQ